MLGILWRTKPIFYILIPVQKPSPATAGFHDLGRLNNFGGAQAHLPPASRAYTLQYNYCTENIIHTIICMNWTNNIKSKGLRQRLLIGVLFGTALRETKQCLLKDLCNFWGRGITWKIWKRGTRAQENFRIFSILATKNVNSVSRHKFNFTAGKVYTNSATRRIWKLRWPSHFLQVMFGSFYFYGIFIKDWEIIILWFFWPWG